jgi:sugar lactone lactonase YvrE
MKRLLDSRLLRAAALIAGILATSGPATGQTNYVVANDDQSGVVHEGVSFYTVGTNGELTRKKEVDTEGFGISGGYFGADRIRTLKSGGQSCVYSSEATTGDVVGIVVSTLKVGGSAKGSKNDGGTSNGIGLAMNNQYLYASFTDSNTIGTFSVQSGCSLTFLNDTSVAGLQGGIINGMAVHGNMLVATYTDGSIESFSISSGTPVSNGDEQVSTATVNSQGAMYPNSVDITSDGHFAIFGDTSTSVVAEVSDISSGKLTKTVVYNSKTSINSGNVMLSADETVLYVADTEGDAITALFFDKTTGALSPGCTSGPIRGISADWSYLGGLALISQSGNGGGVYVAEFGAPSAIGIVRLKVSGATCTLQEDPKSPVADPTSPGLLSIGNFPPRSF